MSISHAMLSGHEVNNNNSKSFQVDMSLIAEAVCVGGRGKNARRKLSHLQGSPDAREGHKGKAVVVGHIAALPLYHIDIGLLDNENRCKL